MKHAGQQSIAAPLLRKHPAQSVVSTCTACVPIIKSTRRSQLHIVCVIATWQFKRIGESHTITPILTDCEQQIVSLTGFIAFASGPGPRILLCVYPEASGCCASRYALLLQMKTVRWRGHVAGIENFAPESENPKAWRLLQEASHSSAHRGRGTPRRNCDLSQAVQGFGTSAATANTRAALLATTGPEVGF